jgi:signal peptidase I
MVRETDVSSGERSQEEDEEVLSPGQFLLEMVKVFLLAAVIIIPVRVFLFQPFFVQGSSMVPNFEDGEYLVVNEMGYKTTNVGLLGRDLFTVNASRQLIRQEPIVFRSPVKDDQYLIKRVIGLPGESIEIRDSKVTVYNITHPEGYVLDESSYLAPTVFTGDLKRTALSTDEYFVLGDNRTGSYDSRMFGPIRRDIVVGEVLFRAWPFTRLTAY